jgi:hypothetical protein
LTAKRWDHRPELLAAYRGTGHELIPLHAPDALDKKGRPIGKAPYKGWRVDPHLTVAEAQAHMREGSNVGVRLRPDDLVVDVDPRNFVEGDDPYQRLQDDLGVDFSEYPRVITGSGGFHVYMKKPEHELLRDTLEAYQGVEFKTLGRQVVAAGSAHPDTGQAYRWDDDALAVPLSGVREAPPALIEVARRPGRIASVDAGHRTPEQLGEMLEGLDPTQFRDHSRWLDLMMAAHHATGGEGRDEWLEWSTSDPEYAKDAWIIGRRWDSLHADQNGRRVTEKTLFKALVDAGRSDLLPRVTAEEQFAGLTAPDLEEVQGGAGETDQDLMELLASLPEGDPGTGPLEKMNAMGYCAVNENGQFRIYRRRTDYTWPGKPREMWETQRKGDFLDILSNVRIQKTVGDKVTVVPLASEWLKWGGRTTYDGVAFDPGNRIPKSARVLNLWTDWAVEPRKGDWSLMRRLLLEGLCDGDEEMYEYVLDWSAFMVQFPDRPAEVAVVFQGAKGSGKGTYFRALGEMAGRHGMHISNQHHFTNHFNSHLRDCVFLFADEAMWAGDKKAEGSLKALITEPTIIIEAKGKDVVTARNHLHVAMASNEDWVIPASMEDERRFAVSRVNDKFRGNKAFFDALHRQMREGGLQAMLWDLKTRDLRDYHPRSRIPQTHALAQQKLQSLDSWDSWWFDCLSRGDLGSENGPAIGNWDDSDPTSCCVFPVDDMKDSLESHLRKVGDRYFGRRSMDTTMGQRLQKRVTTGLKKVRIPCPDGRTDLKADSSGRVYGYRIPSLSECRAMFEEQLGAKLPWTAQVQDFEALDLDADVEDLDPLDM